VGCNGVFVVLILPAFVILRVKSVPDLQKHGPAPRQAMSFRCILYCQETETETGMETGGEGQHSTARHSTAQHSTVQHSTAQHRTAWHGRKCFADSQAQEEGG
jgi:hypothetical protein